MRGFLSKTAAVPRHKKQFRRAYEALHEGNHSWHGTPNPTGILQAGAVKPGAVSMHSPMGVRESYWGAGGPDYGYAGKNNAIVATSTQNILSGPAVRPPIIDHMTGAPVSPDIAAQAQPRINNSVGSGATPAGGYRGLAAAERNQSLLAPGWTQTPYDVPMSRRDLLIASPTTTADQIAQAQSRGMRVIPKDKFTDAWGTLYGDMNKARKLFGPPAPKQPLPLRPVSPVPVPAAPVPLPAPPSPATTRSFASVVGGALRPVRRLLGLLRFVH